MKGSCWVPEIIQLIHTTQSAASERKIFDRIGCYIVTHDFITIVMKKRGKRELASDIDRFLIKKKNKESGACAWLFGLL